jgi:hypothetical protein
MKIINRYNKHKFTNIIYTYEKSNEYEQDNLRKNWREIRIYCQL